MGKIYSVGMAKNRFDVAPEHSVGYKGYKVYHGRIIVYSEKPKDSGY